MEPSKVTLCCSIGIKSKSAGRVFLSLIVSVFVRIAERRSRISAICLSLLDSELITCACSDSYMWKSCEGWKSSSSSSSSCAPGFWSKSCLYSLQVVQIWQHHIEDSLPFQVVEEAVVELLHELVVGGGAGGVAPGARRWRGRTSRRR